MSSSFDLILWKTLSKKSCLSFGEECTSVIIWTLICLILRSILVLLQIENCIPFGFIYAFPYLIQLVSGYIPFMRRNWPILSVRVAECLLGKVLIFIFTGRSCFVF
jgi:hypothetical protein